MIRDITLGQFYPGNSWVHRLDARVKIMVTLLYIVSIFVVKDFIGFALAALGLAVVIAISRVPLKFILRGLKPIFILIAFTFIINMFMIKGEVLVSFWIFTISREGLRMAVFMAIRLILLIIGSSLLTLTTKPISLTDGMEALLSPFKRFGLPAHDLAMMMTIALRFIPTLLEETDKIMKAQMARGADFESGNILRRAKEMGDYLVVVLSTDEFNWNSKQKKCYFTYEQRKQVLEAIRYVDLVIPENNWDQKISDVQDYKIDTFVMGSDWEGKFDFLKDYCEVVYLPRTEGISTTQIKSDLNKKDMTAKEEK